MAFTFIAGSGTQHLTDNMVATGDPLTSLAINMTGANFIVVAVGYYPHQGGQDTKLLSSVTDSSGNTYTRVRTRTGANNNLTSSDVIELWYTSGSSVTVTSSMTFTADFAGATFASISIAGFACSTLPVTVDASNEGFGSGLSLDGGNVTTTVAAELIIGAGTHTGVTFLAGGFTAGTNMTDGGEYDQSSTTSTSYINYRIVSSTGTYASPETANGSSNAWGSQTAAFKEGTGGAGSTLAPGTLALMGVGI